MAFVLRLLEGHNDQTSNIFHFNTQFISPTSRPTKECKIFTLFYSIQLRRKIEVKIIVTSQVIECLLITNLIQNNEDIEEQYIVRDSKQDRDII